MHSKPTVRFNISFELNIFFEFTGLWQLFCLNPHNSVFCMIITVQLTMIKIWNVNTYDFFRINYGLYQNIWTMVCIVILDRCRQNYKLIKTLIIPSELNFNSNQTFGIKWVSRDFQTGSLLFCQPSFNIHENHRGFSFFFKLTRKNQRSSWRVNLYEKDINWWKNEIKIQLLIGRRKTVQLTNACNSFFFFIWNRRRIPVKSHSYQDRTEDARARLWH